VRLVKRTEEKTRNEEKGKAGLRSRSTRRRKFVLAYFDASRSPRPWAFDLGSLVKYSGRRVDALRKERIKGKSGACKRDRRVRVRVRVRIPKLAAGLSSLPPLPSLKKRGTPRRRRRRKKIERRCRTAMEREGESEKLCGRCAPAQGGRRREKKTGEEDGRRRKS
jgi:hypothetical protein